MFQSEEVIRDETMRLRVHLFQPTEDSFVARLRPRLDSKVELTVGRELPPNCDFTVLVAGRPDESFLTASPGLDTLIIPWAGVPVETTARLAGYPGIALHNLHHNAAPVAELAIGLMLAAAKRIVPIDRSLRQNDWRPRWDEKAMIELAGKTATVLGYGAIGRRVTRACQALELSVRALRRGRQNSDPEQVVEYSEEALEKALIESQVLLVTVPLTPETKGLISKRELGLLPDSAIVVNIARGEIIDQAALYAECASGRLRAGLDVWYNYPRSEEARTATAPSDFPFAELDNVVMTPHMGGNSDREEVSRAEALAILINEKANSREVSNRVDLTRGY